MKKTMNIFNQLISIFDSFMNQNQNYWNNYDHISNKRLGLVPVQVKKK